MNDLFSRGLALALFACVSVPAHALTFGGTITQMITETNDSSYHVGQVITSNYTYESPAIDGTFGSTLDVNLYFPFPLNLPNERYSGGWSDDIANWHALSITVAGGLVTNLVAVSEIELSPVPSANTGGYYYFLANTGGNTFPTFSALSFQRRSFDFQTFETTWLPDITTRGVFGFSAPAAVADGGSTFGLFALVISGLLLHRRRSISKSLARDV